MKTNLSHEKQAIFLSLLICFLLFLTGITQAANLKVRVIVDKANVRLKPDITSTPVGKVSIGTVLESDKKEGKWYRVTLPPDEYGFTVSGYIHERIVEVVEEEKPPEVSPPVIQEPVVREERLAPVKPRYTPRRRKAPQRAFTSKLGIGVAFPSGDWSDLFTIGLGANISGSYSILSQPQIDLIGGLEGFYFFRESGYVDVSMSRILLFGDCRFGKKINNISFFAEGGLGLYLDILEVEVWWWRTTESEFEIGARLGGGVTFGNFEIMGMYHIVERNMFTIMCSYIYRF
ncbi:MAG: hypothetical protein ACE5WD_11440 [Candidatus Aminicenantia bacterium]